MHLKKILIGTLIAAASTSSFAWDNTETEEQGFYWGCKFKQVDVVTQHLNSYNHLTWADSEHVAVQKAKDYWNSLPRSAGKQLLSVSCTSGKKKQ
ncbi:hypothetical protein ACVBEF_12830 [Glaciimonas sp. GG7]